MQKPPHVGAGHTRDHNPARKTLLSQTKPGHKSLRLGRFSTPGGIYLVTSTTHERQPVFLNFAAACSAARCFENIELLGDSKMLAWVLMPDHVHWIIQLGEAHSLSAQINRLKSASARAVNRDCGQSGKVWASAFHDSALRKEEDLKSMARYVVANPLRAGLVRKLADYPFWNAMWL